MTVPADLRAKAEDSRLVADAQDDEGHEELWQQFAVLLDLLADAYEYVFDRECGCADFSKPSSECPKFTLLSRIEEIAK